jgi:uncharacterized lipoprotein YddW (UPF0748 family)
MTALMGALMAIGLTVGVHGAVQGEPADRLEIEPAAYADQAAAAAAWRPGRQSGAVSLSTEKTPEGQRVLAFPCDMTIDEPRVYWDRDVRLQLAKYGRVTLWVKVLGSGTAVANFTLYFRSGNGWYSGGFNIHEEGWNRVVLDRATFLAEESPAGWNAIDGMRLSFWKGTATRATVLVGGIVAEAVDVVIVRNSRAGEEQATWAGKAAELLRRAGIEAGTVEDADVEDGALRGKKLAIYPYNTSVSEREAAELRAFVAAGGRVIACYGLPEALSDLLQIENAGYVQADPPGRFAQMRASKEAPRGVPRTVRQSSWNITRARPIPGRSRVVAEWFDRSGRPTGEPAILMSATGAFVTHVLLEDDSGNKVRLVRALIGALAPDVWRRSARLAVEEAGTLRPRWRTAAETFAALGQMTRSSGKANPDLRQAERALERARGALTAGDYEQAVEHASSLRGLLERAYARLQAPKTGEFRAVWCHSPFGVEGYTWDQAAEQLARNGFTAVVPNMLWAGLAHYPSRVLPVDPSVQTRGDQIDLCLKAARRHGLEVHVWKVNFNLSNAPSEFVERLRRERRLQADREGREVVWLCPSHPENFALERDSMVEVVRNYAVDGIHFDYIRYPNGTACYCMGCRERFENRIGRSAARWPADVLQGGPLYTEYQQFRRDNISRVVQSVAEEARRVRPGVKVSAAVFSNWPACREEIGQDWALWVERGWLDFICPMNYTASNAEFRTRTLVHREAVAGRVPLVQGIGASAPGLEPCQVIDQVLITRQEGANGFILFNYDVRTYTEHIPLMGLGLTRVQAARRER